MLANDDLMPGIDPSLYGPVPDHVQAGIVERYPDVRLIWNGRTGVFNGVVRDPGVATRFCGFYLKGWSLCFEWSLALDVQNILAFIRSMDAWEEGFLDKYAPQFSAPPGETRLQRAERAKDALQAERQAAIQAEQDKRIDDAAENFWPNGKILSVGGSAYHGTQDVNEWFAREERRQRDAASRAHSSGKRRPWHGLKGLREPAK